MHIIKLGIVYFTLSFAALGSFNSLRNALGCEPTDGDIFHCLNLSPSASDEEVTQAYRSAVLRTHPDKHPEQKEKWTRKFQRLNELFQEFKATKGALVRVIQQIGSPNTLALEGPRTACDVGMVRGPEGKPTPVHYTYSDFTKVAPSSPLPVRFEPDGPECRAWLNAHKSCGQDEFEAAEALLHSVDFHSFQELLSEIDKQVQGLAQHLNKIRKPGQADNRVVLVVDKGKSNEWLAAHLLKQLEATFRSQGLKLDIVENNKKDATLREERSLEQYLVKNPGDKHFLIIDDALYSGSQVRMWTKDLAWSLHNIKTDPLISDTVKAALGAEPTQLHYIIPFATKGGMEFASGINAEKMNIPGQSGTWSDIVRLDLLGSPKPLLSVDEKIKPKDLKTLQEMYPEAGTPRINDIGGRWHALTSTFFQHKVPSGWSGLADLLRYGRVRCKAPPSYKPSTGKKEDFPEDTAAEAPNVLKSAKTGLDIQFGCVPAIQPPYKTKSDYVYYGSLSRADCSNPPEPFVSKFITDATAKCNEYLDDKEALISR